MSHCGTESMNKADYRGMKRTTQTFKEPPAGSPEGQRTQESYSVSDLCNVFHNL